MIDWPLPAQAAAFAASGYALGCFSAAYYVVRAVRGGADIRAMGSGNAGATNAGVVLGAWGFAAVLALDALKGAAAVWLPRLVDAPMEVRVAAMIGVIAGHLWPAQLGFRGGKGIATAMGAVPAATPWLALHLLIVALAALLATRRTHVAGLAVLAVLLPFARGLGLSPMVTTGFACAALLVVWAHRREIGGALHEGRIRLARRWSPG